MPNITLPDGSVRSFEQPVTIAQVAASIGAGLARAALAGKVEGRLVDTSHLIESDTSLAIVTDKDADGLEVIRHSTAHLLAYAVKELFPNLSFRGGYELNYGGLPGYLSKRMGKAPHSLAQAVTAGLAYDDPGHGYFGSLDVQYGFYGMTGWRIDLNAGKRWSGLIHEKVDLELSAGTGYSSSYWGPGVAGFDQVNIKLAAPVRVTGVDSSRGFRIIPFIQLDWAGNTRSEIRRYAGMNAIEDFRIRVGVEAVYRF